MFIRRLIVLAASMMLVFGVLTIQVLRLSVVEGQKLRVRADSRLDLTSYLPTYRGDIVDRHGRRLATDVACYDVAVSYRLITGSWIDDEAEDLAVDRLGREAWGRMSAVQRLAAIDAERPAFQAIADEIWSAVRIHGRMSDEQLTALRDEIRREVHLLRAEVHRLQRRDWEDDQEDRRTALLSRLDGEQPRFRPQAIREERQPHVILARVSDEVAFTFRRLEQRLRADHPGLVVVQDSTKRAYPWATREVVLDRSTLPGSLHVDEPVTIFVEGIADHVIGSMRGDVWRQDLDRRPFVHPETGAIDLGGYRSSGDRVGATGLEAVFEDHLRGLRGRRVEHRDTGRIDRDDPVPGHDLPLTLDISLQSRVQAILSHRYGLTVVQPWHKHPILPEGWPLNAAAVVLEVASGDVLAAVSMPTIAMARHMDPLRRRMDAPTVFRPAEAVYPPGSIIKPLILCAAVEQGVHDSAEAIHCAGHFFPERKDTARCWIYRDQFDLMTHGDLTAAEALARSCNIYFYTLADRLGLRGLVTWLDRFGLGRTLDVGLARRVTVLRENPVTREREPVTILAGESSGMLADPDDFRHRGGTIFLGIGQGRVAWTPLQAANAFATMARRGRIADASLLLDDPRGSRPRRPDFPLPASLVDLALEGLRQSVEEPHGTGHHITHDDGRREAIFNAPGVTVWGKTGTAQTGPYRVDLDGDGVLAEGEHLADIDHAWFVGLVGPENGQPLYAISVIVEYGGSGGRTSGPIANQIIHTLQIEGYLPPR